MGKSKPGTGGGEAERGGEAGGDPGGSPVPESDGGLSRRDWLKVVGITGAASVVSGAVDTAQAMAPLIPPNGMAPPAPPAEVLRLTSTSDVFVPPRGDAFMKFSFDFPEPSLAFGGLRFGFLVFTDENTYG